MAAPPLTASQLQQYEESGFVMLDARLSCSELDSAEAAHDRCAVHGTTGGAGLPAAAPRTEDEEYVRALSHPFFERVAQQVLRSRRVHLVEDLPHYRAPAEDTEDHGCWDPQAAWAGGCHIDWQVTTSDFRATPRRDMCAIWLWLTDVEPERAAMRIMPKSHVEISAHWQQTLHPTRQSMLPRNYGLFPHPSHNYPTYPQHIVEPAHFQYTELEPTAVVARRGQALVFTQSMLHAGWRNFTPHPRKALIVSWVAADVPFGVGSVEGLGKHLQALRGGMQKWVPGRAHIVPTQAEYHHFDSGLNSADGGKFEETFLPTARL